jgi:hypothetical protein
LYLCRVINVEVQAICTGSSASAIKLNHRGIRSIHPAQKDD